MKEIYAVPPSDYNVLRTGKFLATTGMVCFFSRSYAMALLPLQQDFTAQLYIYIYKTKADPGYHKQCYGPRAWEYEQSH